MRVLILGGTTEARRLGSAMAGDKRFQVILSLAGRTRQPVRQDVPVRIGGFGGTAGLAAYLRREQMDAVIDATHPFAAQISRNAEAACTEAGVALCVLRRPAWRPAPGDRWIMVPGMPEAARALGSVPRQVLLTVGRQELAPFRAAPQHRYVIRSVDPPQVDALPPDAEVITARGPFHEPDERRLLTERQIEILVTKNSGGEAAQAKLAAARALGLCVVMVMRPSPEGSAPTVTDVEATLQWLEARHRMLSARGV
jgi:precorrin-6A/cobalt-precorrin-6A reductase